MIKELLAIHKIDNGYLLTSHRREGQFCPDVAAVAAYVQGKLDEYAAEAPSKSKSAIPEEEWNKLVEELEKANIHGEGKNV